MKKTISFGSILSLVVLVGSLVAALLVLKREEIFKFLSEASGTPANLAVNAELPLGPLPQPWRHLAQGGEDLSVNMFAPVVKETRALAPLTIRLDHLYDGYDVVSRNDTGQLVFNWSRLDDAVATVRQVGATPMLSLSYMPSAISDGDIIGSPKDWNEWALVVQRTIEQYSGTLGIPDIAYEVWNEPDLFGGWKPYGPKNYLTLYQWAATGAARAQGVKPFKLGGPATTGFYANWIDSLANLVETSHVRLDFLSWHRYSKNIDDYSKDFNNMDQALQRHLAIAAGVEIYITESGPNGDVDPVYDTDTSAAHLLAMTRATLGRASRNYTFEIADGKNGDGNEYWGRWGLLTNPASGGHIKPRYRAFQMLNQLSGTRLNVTGEGSWVTAISTKKADGTIQVLVVNYDRYGTHSEQAPIAVSGLTVGNHAISRAVLGGGTIKATLATGADGVLRDTLNLPANSAVLLEITP